MSAPRPRDSPSSLALRQHLSAARLSTCLAACGGDLDDAVTLHAWNGEITGAFWEQPGHVEVVLRNTLDTRMTIRHARPGRSGSWLDDPAGELTSRARQDIATARARVRAKGERASHEQSISELSLGFWRFLVSKTYGGRLWPDLASGFPHAPESSTRRPLTPASYADRCFSLSSPKLQRACR